MVLGLSRHAERGTDLRAGNHSGPDLLDCEWRATDAAVNVLADWVIELDRDGLGATPDDGRRQSVKVAGTDVVADSNPIAGAQTSQSVGETSRLDGLDAIADGVVEEVQLAIELAGGDQVDQGLDGIGRQPGMVVGRGTSRA